MKEKTAFLFSDLHASNKGLEKIKQAVLGEKADLLLFTGDIVNMGEPIWYAEKFIKMIDELEIPLFWVPGNNDFGRAYYKVSAKYKTLEGKIVEMFGRTFTGVGGSPASWSGQYEGERSVDKKAIAGSIFLSHVPPPGIINLSKFDDPRMMPERKFSDAPLVHICGHVHWKWGVGYLGQTKVIKLASSETGHYAILNLENLKVEFKELK
ncbi:MAG: metallophosphoesterase [Patescibacteria group bacterium]|jgi:Icc-related predicted phosphoesterase